MDAKRIISLLVDEAKTQGKKFEDLSPDEQTRLLTLIPEIHQYISEKVKDALGCSDD